jgi:hypothetical protein
MPKFTVDIPTATLDLLRGEDETSLQAIKRIVQAAASNLLVSRERAKMSLQIEDDAVTAAELARANQRAANETTADARAETAKGLIKVTNAR